jgi:hypothetical protein
MMSTIQLRIAVVFALAAGAFTASAQQRPPYGAQYPPDPPANHVEVRFALGKETLTCKHFDLTIKGGEQMLLKGSFASSFTIPSAASTYHGLLDVEIKCGQHKWHFPEVGKWSLQQGWWWVGTDYPPFQEMFQDRDPFKDALWVRYLAVDPIGGEPFQVYKVCPARLKDQKPGPCYAD